MKPTFDKYVWELVNDRRLETLVVDNYHAYGIIKDRLDSLWEQIRLLNPDDDQSPIFGGLIALAAYSQLVAEGLDFVPEQVTADERHVAAEKDAQEAQTAFRNLVATIDRHKKSTRSLQRGTPRFAYEFDEDFMIALRQQAEDLG